MRGRLVLGVVLAAAAVLVMFHRELPAWRWGGTLSVPAEAVGFDAGEPLCPAADAAIELRGDSLVIGERKGGPADSGTPYGRVLAEALGGGREVRLMGRGGATAADGLSAPGVTSAGQGLILIAYGTNDAAVRGALGGKRAVLLDRFRDSLLQHIAQTRNSGAKVALMAPPPVGSQAMAARLQPYREAVRQVGRQTRTSVFDPAEAFAACPAEQPLLTHDALHLNARGHACIGRWLARQLCD